jgi:hypothetical protein
MSMSARWPVGRWVRACAAAETVGMTAAAGAAQVAGWLPPTLPQRTAAGLTVVVLGGLVEGGALGVLQGRLVGAALDPDGRRVRRRWGAVTLLVAGVGWAAASAPAALADQEASSTQPPAVLVLVAAAALGAAMGAVLGLGQAWAVRGAADHPYRWVWGSVIAWSPAMVVIFAGATLPSAAWSPYVVVPVGALTGLAAGTVLGLVSGRLLRWSFGSTAARPGGHSVEERRAGPPDPVRAARRG